jgi:hypothetical protein
MVMAGKGALREGARQFCIDRQAMQAGDLTWTAGAVAR